jgi:exopolyphosphatase/guanosine-5'-triphosphate,3'-diphosphate pyrophosphatase
VADFVLRLFDVDPGTRSINWGNPERELLWAAAILHNAGHYISHSSHHKHSYYLIRNGELLGYTEAEIEVIANVARYHRKSRPKRSTKTTATCLTKQDRNLVNELSAILRVAVALDRRGIGAIASVDMSLTQNKPRTALGIQPASSHDDCASELWNLKDKKLWLEELYVQKLFKHPLSRCP